MGFKTSCYEKQKTVAEVLARVKKFISVEPTGDGNGFAPATQEEISELYEIIRDLASMRWSGDADGDLPIRPPALHDWKRFEASFWFPIPQSNLGTNDPAVELERWRAMFSNLQLAAHIIERELRSADTSVIDHVRAALASKDEKPLEAAELRARLVIVEQELARERQENAGVNARINTLMAKNRELRRKAK